MGKEREIKLRIENLRELRGKLRKLGARPVKPRIHERNNLFDTAKSALAKREELLRIRTETPAGRRGGSGSRSILTFKRPISRPRSAGKKETHKVREEIELDITDHAVLARVFEGLGMRRWFQYEKFRATFALPRLQQWAKGLLLELDETPIGVFLELEGPARAIDRAARALGFKKRDYIAANYIELYREYCRGRGEEPRDMLFARRSARKQRRARWKNAKSFRKCSFFLDIQDARAYHCTRSNFFGDVRAGNELEPGPSRLSRRQKMAGVVRTRKVGRRENAVPYAVGWGGFSSG